MVLPLAPALPFPVQLGYCGSGLPAAMPAMSAMTTMTQNQKFVAGDAGDTVTRVTRVTQVTLVTRNAKTLTAFCWLTLPPGKV